MLYAIVDPEQTPGGDVVALAEDFEDVLQLFELRGWWQE